MALHKREEVDNKKKSSETMNDSNYFYGIGKGKVMNSAHGRYGRDSLSLNRKIFKPFFDQKTWTRLSSLS